MLLRDFDGRLWLDWKQGARELGVAEWTGSRWNPGTPQPRNDSSWVGVEEMRKTIRRAILAP